MTGGTPDATGNADASGRRPTAEPTRAPTAPARATSPAELAGLGFQFVLSILLFLYVGRWLDARLGTSPILLIVGVFVGAGAAFYSMYRRLMAGQRSASGGSRGAR